MCLSLNYVCRRTLDENNADYRELTDAALLAIAQNNYKEAYKHFENAYTMDSNKVTVYDIFFEFYYVFRVTCILPHFDSVLSFLLMWF